MVRRRAGTTSGARDRTFSLQQRQGVAGVTLRHVDGRLVQRMGDQLVIATQRRANDIQRLAFVSHTALPAPH